MHGETVRQLKYDESHEPKHAFSVSERRTWYVVALTAGMMIVELVFGWLTGSLALLADGWHMATHAGALGLAGLAYWFARSRAKDPSFAFGTGKIYALAGYTSAVVLGIVALGILVESVVRLLTPQTVNYGEALPIAIIGLVVNLASMKLLGHSHAHGPGHDHSHGQPDHDHAHREGHDDHDHDHADHDHDHVAHDHGKGHDHDHGDHDHGKGHGHAKDDHDLGPSHPKDATDHNMAAAYMHVLADALTSVLAIGALCAGKYLGIAWLDPVMGIVGGVLILHWGAGLLRSAGGQLLDRIASPKLVGDIRTTLEQMGDVAVADLHVWEVGPGHRNLIASIVSANPRPTAEYREALRRKFGLDHVTVEVHRCPHDGESECA